MPNTSLSFDHPFHHPENIKEMLTQFKEMDRTGKKFGDVIRIYRSNFFTIPVYPVQMKKGTVLFRARRNPSGKNEGLFTCLNQIGLKDPKLVTTYGRANIPGQSTFYASTNEETVVREVTQWYVNDYGRAQDLFSKGVIDMGWNGTTSMMTISAWQVIEDINLALLFGSEDKRSQHIQACSEDRRKHEFGENNKYTDSRNQVIDFFSEQFGKLDVKDQYEYLYSAYYAYEVFNNRQTEFPSIKFDGVQYASVANDLRGENVAINADSFRDKIRFLGANFCFTANNFDRSLDQDENLTAMIGRVHAALLNHDGSFDWVDSENDFDYIVRVGNNYKKLVFPSRSRYPRAVTRIGG